MMNHALIIKISFLSIIFVFVHNLFSQNEYAQIITRHTIKTEDLISILVLVRNEDQSINTLINDDFQVISSPAVLENNIIKIHRGVGSLTTKVLTSDNFNLHIQGLSGQKTILLSNNTPITQISGDITSSTTWLSDSIIIIDENLTISHEATLTIEQGCQVFLGEKVNMFVNGKLKILGTPERPVFLQPIDPNQPWGGIYITNDTDTSNINYSFFIRGGDDEQYFFGHSESQPVLMIENSFLVLKNSFILDNPGKAIGGDHGHINIERCVFSRCDTGGEYHSCQVSINNTYFLEMPNDNGIPIDDDNDASYFYGIYPTSTEPSLVDNCTFISGKDDGIDHNKANLNIVNCWVEGYDNEGIAASNANTISIYNTLIRNCEQGIEAGYGEPLVIVDHCVLLNNNVGLRFGDSYNWGCEGHIIASNSIMYGNSDNIMNFDLLSQGQVEGAIDISFSMTNDIEYDDYPGCITGVPLFDENYYLIPGSPGAGMASDGSDLGLLNPDLSNHNNRLSIVEHFLVIPNPFTDVANLQFTLNNKADIMLQVFNCYGNFIYEQSYQNLETHKHVIPFKRKLDPGLYNFILLVNNKFYLANKVISL